MFVFVTLETSASSSIPVRIVRSNSPSNDADQRTVPRDLCVLCDRPFDDAKSTHICSMCDYKLRYPSSYDVLPSRNNTRTQSNMHLSEYDRGYSPVLSPTPKTRPVSKIICPHCRNPNLVQNLTPNSEYRCTACQNPLLSSYQ